MYIVKLVVVSFLFHYLLHKEYVVVAVIKIAVDKCDVASCCSYSGNMMIVAVVDVINIEWT